MKPVQNSTILSPVKIQGGTELSPAIGFLTKEGVIGGRWNALVLSHQNSWIECKVGTTIFKAESRGLFFSGERLVLEGQKPNLQEWKVVARSFPIHHKPLSDERVSRRPEFLHRKETVSEIIESFFSKEKSEIRTTEIPKILTYLFSPMEWKWEDPFFTWSWNDSLAQGYLVQNRKESAFILEYDSSMTGFCRFLLIWSQNADIWNIYASIRDRNFYEKILQSSLELRKALLQIIPGLSVFEVEWVSSSSILDSGSRLA